MPGALLYDSWMNSGQSKTMLLTASFPKIRIFVQTVSVQLKQSKALIFKNKLSEKEKEHV